MTSNAHDEGGNKIRKTTVVLVPTSKPEVKEIPLARRVNDFNGKVIGYIWNRKPNADILLKEINRLLNARFQIDGTKWHEKTSAALAAEITLIEELVNSSDMVISAMGD